MSEEETEYDVGVAFRSRRGGAVHHYRGCSKLKVAKDEHIKARHPSVWPDWIDRCGVCVPFEGVLEYRNKFWLYDRYWRDRMTIEEMADECDVTTDAIVYWMDEHNIRRRPANVPANESITDPRWLTVKYWGRGLSIAKIADMTGTSASTVHGQMVEHGIPRRPPDGASV